MGKPESGDSGSGWPSNTKVGGDDILRGPVWVGQWCSGVGEAPFKVEDEGPAQIGHVSQEVGVSERLVTWKRSDPASQYVNNRTMAFQCQRKEVWI